MPDVRKGHRVPIPLQWPEVVQARSPCHTPGVTFDLSATVDADAAQMGLPHKASKPSVGSKWWSAGKAPVTQTSIPRSPRKSARS